jgi:hypothetical protein
MAAFQKLSMRHIVAVTLIGWYLMVPLPDRPEAPLAYWDQLGAYDTAKECEDFQARLYSRSQRSDFRAPPGKFSTAQLRQVYAETMCIASDDPRLAK